MQTHFLKFASEDEAKERLAAYVSFDDSSDGAWIAASHTHALDVVGAIYKPTGNTIPGADGEQLPEMAAIDGFHVNLLLIDVDIPEALAAYCTTPKTPSRVFG